MEIVVLGGRNLLAGILGISIFSCTSIDSHERQSNFSAETCSEIKSIPMTIQENPLFTQATQETPAYKVAFPSADPTKSIEMDVKFKGFTPEEVKKLSFQVKGKDGTMNVEGDILGAKIEQQIPITVAIPPGTPPKNGLFLLLDTTKATGKYLWEKGPAKVGAIIASSGGSAGLVYYIIVVREKTTPEKEEPGEATPLVQADTDGDGVPESLVTDIALEDIEPVFVSAGSSE